MTAICPNCGKPVRPGARFCGNCRADLSAAGQTCPYCRAPISPAAQSCPKCGKALPAGLSSPPTPASGSITLPALTPSRQTGAAPTQRVSPPASIPTTPIETSPPRKSAGPLAITGALVLSLCCLASLIGGFVFREQLPFFGVTSTPPALPSLPTLVPSLTASATLTASALPPTATPTLKPTRTSTFTPSPTLTPLITPTLTLSPTQPADVPSLTPPAFIPAPNDIISETFDAQWQEQWSFGVNVLPMPGENPSLQLAGDPKKAWIVSRTDVPLKEGLFISFTAAQPDASPILMLVFDWLSVQFDAGPDSPPGLLRLEITAQQARAIVPPESLSQANCSPWSNQQPDRPHRYQIEITPERIIVFSVDGEPFCKYLLPDQPEEWAVGRIRFAGQGVLDDIWVSLRP